MWDVENAGNKKWKKKHKSIIKQKIKNPMLDNLKAENL